MKTITNIIYLAFALCAISCFALSAKAQVNCQEGCDLNGGGTTVLGDVALINNMGGNNTGIGSAALVNNTFGSDNTAIGAETLEANTTGNNNTAIGVQALLNNTGSANTAMGVDALYSNTEGQSNTANGFEALLYNSIGANNTATGALALFENTGDNNTANGVSALESNTTGTGNTAVGLASLQGNTTGSNNIALGNNAGFNLTTGSNNIDIGNAGVAGEAGKIRIGTKGTQRGTFIAGISGATVANGVGVIINSQGQLGTVVSSLRFKDAVKPMDKASEAIMSLKPVTFRYKKELDPDSIPQFGLVAEDVAKVDPDLVARDDEGKPYTVRYEAVNAMLLNEFLKEHRKMQEQQAMITELRNELQATAACQQKQLETLTAGLQKVNAQLELSKPAPRTALNNQ